MCSHYEGVWGTHVLRNVFQLEPPADMGKADLWPGYQGLLICRPREKDSGMTRYLIGKCYPACLAWRPIGRPI